MFSRFGTRENRSAGDERQDSCHTTHNAFVLLLFLFPQLAGKSQWRDSDSKVRTTGGRPSTAVRKLSISIAIRLNAGRHSAKPM